MRRPTLKWLLFGLMSLWMVILLIGCGGGGNPGDPPSQSIAKFKSFSGNSVSLGDLQGKNAYLFSSVALNN